MDETQNPTNWSNTVQDWGGMLLDRWSTKQFAQPVPVPNTGQGPTGRPYIEGQAMQPTKVGGMVISPMMIGLAVAAVAAVVLLRR